MGGRDVATAVFSTFSETISGLRRAIPTLGSSTKSAEAARNATVLPGTMSSLAW